MLPYVMYQITLFLLKERKEKLFMNDTFQIQHHTCWWLVAALHINLVISQATCLMHVIWVHTGQSGRPKFIPSMQWSENISAWVNIKEECRWNNNHSEKHSNKYQHLNYQNFEFHDDHRNLIVLPNMILYLILKLFELFKWFRLLAHIWHIHIY